MNVLSTKMSNLSRRDKHALWLMIVFIMGAVLFYAWQTMNEKIQDVQIKLADTQSLIQYMQLNEEKIKLAKNSQPKDILKQDPHISAFSQIEKIFRSPSTVGSQMNPSIDIKQVSAQKIKVSAEEIVFTDLVDSIDKLARNGITVEKLTAIRLQKPGYVKVDLTFSSQE